MPSIPKGYALTEAERQFAALIWRHEPVASPRLTQLAEAEFGWKRSTTYTMLKRLENKGVFENAGGTVRALVTAEEVDAAETARFVQKTFDGSLPRFLAAFVREKPLTDREVEELQALIDRHRRGE